MNAAGEAYKHIYLTVFGQYTSTLLYTVRSTRLRLLVLLHLLTVNVFTLSSALQFLPASVTVVGTLPWWWMCSLGNRWPWSASPTQFLLPPSPGTRTAGRWQNQPTCASWQKGRCLRSRALRWDTDGYHLVCSLFSIILSIKCRQKLTLVDDMLVYIVYCFFCYVLCVHLPCMSPVFLRCLIQANMFARPPMLPARWTRTST